tara:strand:+ start:1929 stop:2903 length:975 start_codon:yes stop_codon:yes gene_type:complete
LNACKNIIPGLLLTLLIGYISLFLGNYISIGSVAIAILLGFILNNTLLSKYSIYDAGVDFSEKKLLSAAIILLGASLNFSFLNFKIILLILLMIIFSILICYLVGGLLGLDKNLSILLGIGNGICGSSAIAGASKIINPNKEQIGISIAIINFLGAISIPIMPILFIYLFPSFSENQYGFVIGSTVQALGQVVAAGNMISNNVGDYATIIKMIRIAMLGPILLVLNFIIINKPKVNSKPRFFLPGFIVGFVVLAVIAQLKVLPIGILEMLKSTSKFLLVIAMAGIGFKISLKDILKFGKKSFLVGSLGFIFQVFIACGAALICF